LCIQSNPLDRPVPLSILPQASLWIDPVCNAVVRQTMQRGLRRRKKARKRQKKGPKKAKKGPKKAKKGLDLSLFLMG
jgi:hypothetical protein